jgi:hypothetical protein
MGERRKKSATFAFCLPETEQMSKLFLKQQKRSFFWFVFVLLEHGPSQIDLFHIIVAK